MKIPIYQIDNFTNKVFAGNPAAICPLESWLSEDKMQSIAAENNLSETAFFVKEEDFYKIRWFTPTQEVDLCGHATLASAHVLYQYYDYPANNIKFESKSGPLFVEKQSDCLVLDFPSRPPLKVNIPHKLIDGLGKAPKEVLKDRDYVAVFETEKEVLDIEPNFEVLNDLDCLGIIVTAKGSNCDFVSRFFAPSAGVNEDPVTGSAHSELIPYWSAVLGKHKLSTKQISKRGGELFCELVGDRVKIGGQAVTYLVGEIEV